MKISFEVELPIESEDKLDEVLSKIGQARILLSRVGFKTKTPRMQLDSAPDGLIEALTAGVD